MDPGRQPGIEHPQHETEDEKGAGQREITAGLQHGRGSRPAGFSFGDAPREAGEHSRQYDRVSETHSRQQDEPVPPPDRTYHPASEPAAGDDPGKLSSSMNRQRLR